MMLIRLMSFMSLLPWQTQKSSAPACLTKEKVRVNSKGLAVINITLDQTSTNMINSCLG